MVSVASHLVGNQIKQMMGLLLEGEVERAAAEHRRLLEIFKVLFIVSNPIPSSTPLTTSASTWATPACP